MFSRKKWHAFARKLAQVTLAYQSKTPFVLPQIEFTNNQKGTVELGQELKINLRHY